MRSILVFLLVIAGCISNKKGSAIENTFYPYHSEDYGAFKNSRISLASLMFWQENTYPHRIQEMGSPQVKIRLPQDTANSYEWNAFVRYSIDVLDTIDGASKYGEINEGEVFLEIEFIPIENAEELVEKVLKDRLKKAKKETEHMGLALMKNSTCFGCHADKATHTGPSFSEIADRYENTSTHIVSLSNSILEGSKGLWGNTEMPSNPDLTVSETEQISKFILEQGAKKNNWIIPGLEGTFRIIEKPKNIEQGFYILTASYTSTSKMRGQDSILLNIR
ncbi:c-type cytochrome [Pareuzebyella sediminis]|uniref:c-type cytochrome n=1 Tax=Pareuzebyella sediminis TaxID=2607998 RepID=UPI0011EBA706|nr:c-type cytochrome [Pareuzebyella sediminis]